MDIVEQIKKALERIDTYRDHDHCSMEEDTTFQCNKVALEEYSTLLSDRKDGPPYLTEAGRVFLISQAKQLIGVTDDTATELGLIPEIVDVDLAGEYDTYFTRMEQANRLPLSFEQWKTEREK